MKKGLAFAWCVIPGLLAACGSNLTGIGDSGTPGDAGHDTSVTVEAGEPGQDGNPPPTSDASDGGSKESSTDGTIGKEDVASGDDSSSGPDVTTSPDVVEEPVACSGSPNTSAASIFVVVGGTNSGSCGSQASPCGTVAWALGLAAKNAAVNYIYVGPGPFSEGELTLVNGVSIQGGWLVSGINWTRNCLAPEIDVTLPVMANGLTSPTTLDTLSIVNNETATTAGESLYGLISDSSTLVLNDVSISVPATAGAGAAGANATTPGAPGGSGCTAGGGGAGGLGTGGAAAGAGAFGSSGYTPAGPGAAGNPGGSGGNGTKPVTPATVPVDGGTCVTNPDPPPIGSNCEDITTQPIAPNAGVPGCGGSGGAGGVSGGYGGGCNIPLYVWGGTVALTGGTLTAGSGGAGGAGGTGETGGAGSAGAAGTSTFVPGCCQSGGTGCISKVNECSSTSIPEVPGGPAGGSGGTGGTGGQAGGAAGGCSYAYYSGGSATVTVSGTVLNHGTGGALGAPNGTAGPAGPHN